MTLNGNDSVLNIPGNGNALIFDPNEEKPILLPIILENKGIDFKVANSLAHARELSKKGVFDILFFSKDNTRRSHDDVGVIFAREFYKKDRTIVEMGEIGGLKEDDEDEWNGLSDFKIAKSPRLIEFIKTLNNKN